MKRTRLPKGWTEKQIRALAARHDMQTEEEQAAEIEGALSKSGQTLIVVPTELVPKIVKMIAKKRPA